MKKLLLSCCSLLAVYTCDAQWASTPSVPSRPSEAKRADQYPVNFGQYSKTRSFNKTNTDPSAHIDTVIGFMQTQYDLTGGRTGTIFTAYVEPMFPDSTVTTSFENGSHVAVTDHVHTHKIGTLIEPTYYNFGGYFANSVGDGKMTQYTPYKIKSVLVDAMYHNVNSVFEDSLIIEVTYGTAADNTDHNADKPFIHLHYDQHAPEDSVIYGINCDNSKNRFGNSWIHSSNTVKRFAYNLTSGDSVGLPRNGTGYHYRTLFMQLKNPDGSQGINIPAGNIVAIAISYVPGYIYSPENHYFTGGGGAGVDSINSFTPILYYETDPAHANQFYAWDPLTLSGNCWLNTVGRYMMEADPNREFVNHSLEPLAVGGFNIQAEIEADVNGISNAGTLNGMFITQNKPNPFNHSTMVSYQLGKNTSAVSLEISDITGRKLMSLPQGAQLAGAHSISFEGSSLHPGVYFYSLNAEGVSSDVRKMIVTE